jgi:hypothetical protein
MLHKAKLLCIIVVVPAAFNTIKKPENTTTYAAAAE